MSSTISSEKNRNKRALSEKYLRKIERGISEMRRGVQVEWRETRALPGQLLRGEFRKVGAQMADLGRMGLLVTLWILPGGAVISGVVVKIFGRIRPSAFRDDASDQNPL